MVTNLVDFHRLSPELSRVGGVPLCSSDQRGDAGSRCIRRYPTLFQEFSRYSKSWCDERPNILKPRILACLSSRRAVATDLR
jgi:hypothetical protein